jgi:hypothetical protein
MYLLSSKQLSTLYVQYVDLTYVSRATTLRDRGSTVDESSFLSSATGHPNDELRGTIGSW